MYRQIYWFYNINIEIHTWAIMLLLKTSPIKSMQILNVTIVSYLCQIDSFAYLYTRLIRGYAWILNSANPVTGTKSNFVKEARRQSKILIGKRHFLISR